MALWAAAGARTRAKTAARIARAIGPAFRVVHRLRRARTSPAPTAAMAPTTAAMSGRFSGADGVMSGPPTVAPGETRTGRLRGKGFDAGTDIETCARPLRAAAAPLGPPVDWARRPTLTGLAA